MIQKVTELFSVWAVLCAVPAYACPTVFAPLAIKHFSTLAALPSAIFSIGYNLSGSCLAWHWSRRSEGVRGAEDLNPRTKSSRQ